MIANDALDASRVQAGKFVLSMSDFRLDRLVNSNLRLFTAELHAQVRARSWLVGMASLVNSELLQDIEHALLLAPSVTPDLWLRSDPQRISQVIINLLSNALKFTKGSAHRRIVVKASVEPHPTRSGREVLVWIAVGDTGIGMTLEEQAKVRCVCFSSLLCRSR